MESVFTTIKGKSIKTDGGASGIRVGVDSGHESLDPNDTMRPKNIKEGRE